MSVIGEWIWLDEFGDEWNGVVVDWLWLGESWCVFDIIVIGVDFGGGFW